MMGATVLTIINQYAALIILVLLAIMLLFFLQLMKQKTEIKQLKKRYNTLTRGMDGQNYGQVLEELINEGSVQATQLKELTLEVKELNKRQKANLNRVAIMHYNAFDFTYGELSFSLAVLDDVGNGFVFTNIHNRDDARCYCKRIIGGESKHPLSDEEKEVLEYALNGESAYRRQGR